MYRNTLNFIFYYTTIENLSEKLNSLILRRHQSDSTPLFNEIMTTLH